MSSRPGTGSLFGRGIFAVVAKIVDVRNARYRVCSVVRYAGWYVGARHRLPLHFINDYWYNETAHRRSAIKPQRDKMIILFSLAKPQRKNYNIFYPWKSASSASSAFNFLPKQNHLLHILKFTCVDPVEINTTGLIASIPSHFIFSGLFSL